MKLRKNIKKILAVGCIALLGATLSGCQPAITIEDVNKAVAEKEAEMLVEKENAVSEAITNAVDGVDITSDNEQAINDAIGAITIESVPDALKEQILEDAKEVQEEVDAETELNGYDIDNLELGAEFDATVSDRDLKTLFDGELDFKGDDYDAEEILTLENLKIAINENDFGSVSYLQIPDEGIVYKFTIENSLDTSDIDEDDTLKFNFLGEEVEVSEWDGDTITFTKGIKHAMKEGEIFEVLDKTITMKTIGSDTIYIDVDGEVLFIDEDETKDVNGIEIKLVRVLDSDEAGSDVAELKIGEDVTNEIESGDEYSKDSIWEYVITSNSIGLTLTEEFKDIDDD
ncbi:MAG: hypothetical protein U9O94_08865, partial [Nanoarchaeota archaeon]|nr:hypothetical protein [Nanoarchaeota archaeon]